MAGYREFQTGEVLTAANVDDFLAKQAVMKFADSAARDTALGTAVAGGNALREGMASYLDDTNEFEVYDGTSWNGLGGLVAVKHVLKTDTFVSGSVTGGDNVTVTGMSITHEVADAANRLIISAFFGSAATTEQTGRVGIAVHDGTGLIAVGDADGTRARLTAGGRISSSVSNSISTMPSVTFVHTPGAGSKTYTLRAINATGTTETLYVNRREQDSDGVDRIRTASALVIQEVKV